jgi:hypothetical protein
MWKRFAKIRSFISTHFVSAFIASLCIFLVVILTEKGLSRMPVLYISKVFFALYLGVTIAALPFSILFFGLPELYGKVMPVWLFTLLGAGFGLTILVLIYAGSGGAPNDASEVASFASVLLVSGLAAGAVFGAMRRRWLLQNNP